METKKWIVMPSQGLTARDGIATNATTNLLGVMNNALVNPSPSNQVPGLSGVKVLDSLAEDGAKLVEMNDSAALSLKAAAPGLRVLPLVYYKPCSVRLEAEELAEPDDLLTLKPVHVKISADGGAPIVGAMVVAFTNLQARLGSNAYTDETGEAVLKGIAPGTKVELLLVYPLHSFWSKVVHSVTVEEVLKLELISINPQHLDCVQSFYAEHEIGDGTGVRVGVIDTGIGPHPDLSVKGGTNTTGEDRNLITDGHQHGTHVAGIIARRNQGIAPNVELFSYRIFRDPSKNDRGASNWAIIKAIYRAVKDNCDVLNMSFGGGMADEATKSAIDEARRKGTLCVVAAGNDGARVSYPAAFQLSVAVSALGREGTFPSDSSAGLHVSDVRGADSVNFVARFSNRGPEIDVVGPGVAVVSTVPGGKYAEMSGTSMACPAVTGVMAALLSAPQNAWLLKAKRDSSRSDDLARLLFNSAKQLGFGIQYEGHGLPGVRDVHSDVHDTKQGVIEE